MNRKVYYLDLQTLLDYLSVHGESCLLSKTLKERGQTGYVEVRAGSMISCYIQEGERVVLQGKQAFKVLARFSEWQVQLQNEQTPLQSLMSPPDLPSSTNSPSLPIIRPNAQLPTTKPGISSGQWPATRPTTTSGQWPVLGPGFARGWHPRMRRNMMEEEFTALPMRQRVVLRLVLTKVNGVRSVEEIKAQLQLSPETVESALAYLRARGIIE
ncbi:sigma-70 family RNA polymerase sigma factor [Ktedonobacter sp. SOSP1-85]|uniref:sigma-70 family RNA polymerase sigma factor n=1 Tax=Ktedonobacter sp. SOSP1-85 TaxID=2778367 RepID=UPI001916402E|nr:sigma-70 family RNA polymerase sigma factor [Ktedonobacter sp. SOSP1-85]